MTRRSISLKDKQPLTLDQFKEQAFFDVYETDAAYLDTYGNWQRSPDKKSLVRADGSYVSTVGKNYSIVDNQTYFEGVVEALTQSEIEYIPKQVYADQKSTTMIVTLPQFKLYGGTNEQQDFELRIRNSFDTTRAADTILGFLRLICTNGMTAFEQSFKHRMIHKGDVLLKTEQAIELFQDFNGVFDDTKKKIEWLGNTTADRRLLSNYIGDGETTLNRVFEGERWAKKVLTSWQENGETNNLFELYNIFTYFISHEYGSNYNSKMNKMDALNKEVKRWPTLLLK